VEALDSKWFNTYPTNNSNGSTVENHIVLYHKSENAEVHFFDPMEPIPLNNKTPSEVGEIC